MQQTNEPRTVLVRACQYLWLVLANGVHDDSLPLTMRRSLPPNPVMLGVPALSRDDCRRPRGRGSSVPAAPHRAVASAAYAGRLPAVQRRVPLRSSVGTIIQATSCRTHLTQFSEVELFVRRLYRLHLWLSGFSSLFYWANRAVAGLAVRIAHANRRSGRPFFDRSRLFRISVL